MPSKPPQPPALILLHGWCCNAGDWQEQQEMLEKDFEVLRFDLPDHGEAVDSGFQLPDTPEDGMSAIAEWVLPQLEQRQRREFVLVGHSMGGAISLELTRHKPQGLVGVVPVDTFLLDLGGMDPDTITRLSQAFDDDFAQAVEKMLERSVGPRASESLRADILNSMTRCKPDRARQFWSALLHWDPTPALATCQAPIHAINSPMLAEQTCKRLAPFMANTVIPATGHFLHREAPAAFSQTLQGVVAGFASADHSGTRS